MGAGGRNLKPKPFFKFNAKSGVIRDSVFDNDNADNRVYIDVPKIGDLCLIDDIEQLIVSVAVGFNPFNYEIAVFPQSHHT